MRYDSRSGDDVIFGTGLGCKGIVDVLVQSVDAALAAGLQQFTRAIGGARTPGTIVTAITTASEAAVVPGESEFHTAAGLLSGRWDRQPFCAEIRRAAEDALHLRQTRVVPLSIGAGAAEFLVEVVLPPVHVVAFGGWLDLLPLGHMARELGWDVTVVDVRARARSAERFGGIGQVILAEAAEAVSAISWDERTVAVSMNHSFELDTQCLRALLSSNVRYIGMLGPKRRTSQILENIAKQGQPIPEARVKAVRGPIGLDIGAENPDEIALAILAEIRAFLSGHGGRPASLRQLPLHAGPENNDA